jgi:hypothetical protein
MAFNPLEEKGIPLDRQIKNWQELNLQPYDKREVHPYTRTRIIAMNGIEVEAAFFSHQFARHCPDADVKRFLALTRRIEQQQQKRVNWLIPGDESTLEVTLGYEQVAVDLTAWLARNEPDPYLKQAFEFGLLEDFDHLYLYANLAELLKLPRAEEVTGDLTEIIPGRPTVNEHRHPYDDVRNYADRTKANPLSILHVLTLIAAEQQTMNFYMTVGNRQMEPVARGLYLEIGQIEEQHVTHYESLMDPRASWWEMLVLHEYNECYLYHSFLEDESDPRVKQVWETHLAMELEHLRLACEAMRKYEKREPREFLAKELPPPTKFQSNKEYIRQVLATQMELNADGPNFVPGKELPPDHRYFQYQKAVNVNGQTPSLQVVRRHIDQFGGDYRLETDGPHPYAPFRDRSRVPKL